MTDLAQIIRTKLLGVRPEDQDVVLEDADWRLILDALERSDPGSADPGQPVTNGERK